MAALSWILGLAILALAMYQASGSTKVKLEIVPKSFTPLLTKTLRLRCDVTPVASSASHTFSVAEFIFPDLSSILHPSSGVFSDEIKFVTSIVIRRDGLDIASVSYHNPAKAVSDMANMQVSGNATGTRGFVELQWQYPTSAQAGNYSCKVAGTDSVNHNVVYTKWAMASVDPASVSNLALKVHDQDLEIQELKTEVNHLKTEQNVQIKKNQDDILKLKALIP